MKKFIELCKKPLLIVSALLFVAFAVLLAIAYTTPFGNTYAVTSAVDYDGVEINIEAKVTFLSDKELETSLKIVDSVNDIKAKADESLGEEIDIAEIEALIKHMEENASEKFSYTKENGKIIINYDPQIPDVEPTKIEFGEIKGYKINGITFGEEDKKIEYVCSANKPAQIASIVLLCVSGVMVIGCVVVLILDKVGVISKKEDAPTAVEAQ